MSDLPYVETWPSVEFICEKCGKNSHASLVNVEKTLTPDELKEFCEKVLGEKEPIEEMQAMWLLHPTTVKCTHCGTEYNTYQGVMEDDLEDLEEEEE